MSKGLMDYLKEEAPDVVGFQEIKADPSQFPLDSIDALGYHHYWFPAQKKGYSGVAIFSKAEPAHVEYGCGNPEWDAEGRVIRADFKDFSLLNIYFPSGSSGDHRQEAKYRFLDFIYEYIHTLNKKIKNLVVCGDYNICHREIDIHDPKGNKNSSGFLPEEREWMEKFFSSGFVDSFRLLHPEPHQYSWWSFRAAARSRNKGWRIDYAAVSAPLEKHISESFMHQHAKHSDHCPVGLVLKF